MTVLSMLEHYLSQPVRRLLLPVAAAAVFGYAPLTNAMDSKLADDLYKLHVDLDALGNSSSEDPSVFLTPAKRKFLLDTYDKCVRINAFVEARELTELGVHALVVNKRLSEEDRQGYLPLVSSLHVKLGMRPFVPGSTNDAKEQRMISQFNAAMVNCTRATHCRNRDVVAGNLLEGIAQKAMLYDNNPSLAYIVLTYGSYCGVKQTNDTRTLLASAQRGCSNEYAGAIQLARSLTQFRSASQGGQHVAAIKMADAILSAFDDKKYPLWPFTDIRTDARLRRAYALHCQDNDKEALATAESCQTEFPWWDMEPLTHDASKNAAGAYVNAERVFLMNSLRLPALGGMVDASEGPKRERLLALLNAIQPDGALAQEYKADKPAGATAIDALDGGKTTGGTTASRPEENE